MLFISVRFIFEKVIYLYKKKGCKLKHGFSFDPNKKELSEKVYNDLNTLFGNSPVSLMNHGYAPSYDFVAREFSNQSTLYLKLLEKIDTEGKTLLDIGCGRGGGVASYLKHNDIFKLKKIYGCDLNKINIQYCKKNHSKKIKFKISDAQDLSYRNKKFDIVTNLESSHGYVDFIKFVSEAERVLKDDGVFIHSDVYYSEEEISYTLDKLKNKFANIETIDITENVARSCHEDITSFTKIQNYEISNSLIENCKLQLQGYTIDNHKYTINICRKS